MCTIQELSIADYNQCVVVLAKEWPMQVSLLVLSINLYTSTIVAYRHFFLHYHKQHTLLQAFP